MTIFSSTSTTSRLFVIDIIFNNIVLQYKNMIDSYRRNSNPFWHTKRDTDVIKIYIDLIMFDIVSYEWKQYHSC